MDVRIQNSKIHPEVDFAGIRKNIFLYMDLEMDNAMLLSLCCIPMMCNSYNVYKGC